MNVGSSTRMTQTKLEKTFYKELEPFEKEGINWNAFVWRVNGKFRSQKYTNQKFIEDDQQIIGREY